MRYRNLKGETVEGEAWCAGPYARTVWVLAPDEPGGAVVVHLRSNLQQTYQWPTFPTGNTPTREEVSAAHRTILTFTSGAWKDKKPSVEQFDAAMEIMARHSAQQIFTAAHFRAKTWKLKGHQTESTPKEIRDALLESTVISWGDD